MRALRIALKDLRIKLEDRNTLVLMLLMPVVLTAIMGFAFGRDSGISDVKLSVVGPEEGGLLADGAAALLNRIDIFEAEAATEEDARAAVSSGRRSAAIVLPSGLLDAVVGGDPVEIRVLKDPASSIKAGIAESMVEQFAGYASSGGILGRSIYETIDSDEPMTDAESLGLAGWMFNWMRDAWSEPPIAIESADQEVRRMDVRSYFAPSLAIFFLLFTMIGSAKSIHEEREAGTFGRLRTAPISDASIVAGKLLGTYLLAVVQLLALIALAALLFGVDWGSSPTALLAMALVTAAGAAAIATLIAAATSTGRQTEQVGTVAVLVMSVVGGSMWPVTENLEPVARLTFNYWAQRGFNQLVFHDAGLAGIARPLLVTGLVGAVAFALAVALLARRQTR